MIFDILSEIIQSVKADCLIPDRDEEAIVGSQWVTNNMDITDVTRNNDILSQILSGNIPDFLRKFSSVTISVNSDELTYFTMPDYLSIGNDKDYVRVPMDPLMAQKIADKFDCSLPTVKMVNQIWKASVNKLQPKPWGPPYNGDMLKTHRIGTHNSTINKQLVDKDPFALTSGHKKDVVLTNRLYPNNPAKKVAIYGWIQTNGAAIQPLNPVSHESSYFDYSHGIRLISNDCILNKTPFRLQDIFTSSTYSKLVSDEVPFKFLHY